jgi:hypothetical protein
MVYQLTDTEHLVYFSPHANINNYLQKCHIWNCLSRHSLKTVM